MKTVVTGSSGFLGARLVEKLLARGDEVLGLDLSSGCDICDWSQVNHIDNFDILYHLAAMTFVPDSYEKPREFYHVNMLSTLNALELCRINGAKMVFASSYVYGTPKYLPIDESHPLSSFNPYSQSKIIGEQLCESYHRDFGVPVVILRPFNIYGKGQDARFLIPSIIKQARAGSIELKDSMPRRDWVYVDDVIEAYIKTSDYDCSDYDVFNIGSGESHSVKEIVDMLLPIIGHEISVHYSGEKRKNEILDTIADISKAREKLLWQPVTGLCEGLRKLIE